MDLYQWRTKSKRTWDLKWRPASTGVYAVAWASGARRENGSFCRCTVSGLRVLRLRVLEVEWGGNIGIILGGEKEKEKGMSVQYWVLGGQI